MLPEWHEQLRSGDQSFWFRAMVATDSAEVTDIDVGYFNGDDNNLFKKEKEKKKQGQ